MFLTIGCGSSDSLRLIKQKNNQLNDHLTTVKNELHLCSKQQHFWWVGFDVCDRRRPDYVDHCSKVFDSLWRRGVRRRGRYICRDYLEKMKG